MLQLLVPILAFLAVVAVGGAVLLLRGARRQAVQARLSGGDASGVFPAPRPLVERLEQVGQRVSDEKSSGELRDRLIRAGYYNASAPAIYAGLQLFLLLASLGLSLLLVVMAGWPFLIQVCVVVAVTGVFTLLPTLVVGMQARRRMYEVWAALPDAVDLLEICVSAGMGLDAAWNAVAEEVRGFSQLLADEMALANLEIHLGSSRAEAMRNLARRTGAEEINSLVTVLVQSERFGTSVAQSLRTFAEGLRMERSARAEETAEKMSVKLLFPMVVFIFPVLLVVILGPAVIKIYDTLSQL